MWFSSCNRFYSCPFYWHPVGNHLCMCNLKHSKTRMVQIKLPQLLHLPCVHGIFTFTTMSLFLNHLRCWLQVHLKHRSMHKTYHIQTNLYLPYDCFSVHVSFQSFTANSIFFLFMSAFNPSLHKHSWNVLRQNMHRTNIQSKVLTFHFITALCSTPVIMTSLFESLKHKKSCNAN